MGSKVSTGMCAKKKVVKLSISECKVVQATRGVNAHKGRGREVGTDVYC